MKKDDAKNVVESIINETFDSTETGPLIVIDSLTREKSYGFVFFANTKLFLESGDRRASVIGVGPIVFESNDRSIIRLASSTSAEEAIRAYEKEHHPELFD